uniref:Taste receptor type 2 n=1 Tax=Scleropages formosus TaxID=113540 RepID=A0A8C9U4Y4_SCLFO
MLKANERAVMLPHEVRLAIWVMMGFTAILTILFNLFILLMSLHSYRHNGHWMPCETIITALSLANGAYQLVSYSWVTLEEVDRMCYLDREIFSFLLVTVFSLKFTIIWITAFLTFFYSTKLVIEPIHCYTKIQEAFLKHAGTVVVVIPICGFGICMPLLTVFDATNSTVSNNYCSTVTTDSHTGGIYLGCYLLISDIAPGLLILKSSISITVHLVIHLRHMKASNNGFHVPKLSSEMRVVRMTLILVVVFLCFLFMDLFTNYVTVVHGENIMEITMFFTSLYIAISSLVLIYGKKSFWKGLLHQYNVFLDEFLCLRCLKVPETKAKVNPGPGH